MLGFSSNSQKSKKVTKKKNSESKVDDIPDFNQKWYQFFILSILILT